VRKLVISAMVFASLAGVFCGGKAGSQAPATVEKWPAEATGELTENDVARLVKVLPALDAALKADSWRPAMPREGDGPVAALAGYVESMNVPGVDDSLKKAGSNWSEVRATLYKAFAATTALSIDRTTPEMLAQVRKDTSAAARKALEGYPAFKAAYSQIPAENKRVFAKHEQELQFLYTLGR
jgi:hypothetical protein